MSRKISILTIEMEPESEPCQFHSKPVRMVVCNETFGSSVYIFDCGCMAVTTKGEKENALSQG